MCQIYSVPDTAYFPAAYRNTAAVHIDAIAESVHLSCFPDRAAFNRNIPAPDIDSAPVYICVISGDSIRSGDDGSILHNSLSTGCIDAAIFSFNFAALYNGLPSRHIQAGSRVADLFEFSAEDRQASALHLDRRSIPRTADRTISLYQSVLYSNVSAIYADCTATINMLTSFIRKLHASPCEREIPALYMNQFPVDITVLLAEKRDPLRHLQRDIAARILYHQRLPCHIHILQHFHRGSFPLRRLPCNIHKEIVIRFARDRHSGSRLLPADAAGSIPVKGMRAGLCFVAGAAGAVMVPLPVNVPLAP